MDNANETRPDAARNTDEKSSLVEATAPRIPAEIHSHALILLTIFAAVFILDWAQPFFIPLILGVIISYALSPLVNRLHKWHVPRAIGAALLLLMIVGGERNAGVFAAG